MDDDCVMPSLEYNITAGPMIENCRFRISTLLKCIICYIHCLPIPYCLLFRIHNRHYIASKTPELPSLCLKHLRDSFNKVLFIAVKKVTDAPLIGTLSK